MNDSSPSKENKDERLVWIDMEMTGLDPETDRVLEIATLITDGSLNILAQGPVFAVHQSDEVLNGMDDWNTKHHGESGLTERSKQSNVDVKSAESQTLEFIRQHVNKRTAPLCGNSIGQDRRFIVRYMPALDQFLHYRSVDVSTVKELVKRWYPELPPFKKMGTHTALEDIKESIGELTYYKEKVFR